MGNKSKICQQIYEITQATLGKESNIIVFDPFSGTTNVSRYFKNQGIDVICNDINDLSYVLAKCYIECSKIPTFERLFANKEFVAKINGLFSSIDTASQTFISDNRNTTDISFINRIRNTNYLYLLVYLTYFASEQDWSEQYDPYYLMQKNYCEDGEHSKYLNQVHKKTIENLKKSFSKHSEEQRLVDAFLEYPYSVCYLEELSDVLLRHSRYREKEIVDSLLKKNLVGSRRFFSVAHGKRIDIILNVINYWYKAGLLEELEYYVLQTAVLESIAIFSNTSATYQAFYKDYKANTQQRFRLVIPVIDETKIHAKIYQEDVCALISKVDADVLYLDPPYNWRQYDSNYHLLNTVARFGKIRDWSQFEKGIVGASGENREEKLKYTSFNVKKGFEDLLMQIIQSSPCNTIVLSYSDSKSNHERDEINTTLNALQEFFGNRELFVNYRMHQIQSVNFESRKGNKKNSINELLFIAQRH